MISSASKILAIDVGTGLARAGLMDRLGLIHHLVSVAHSSHYPRHGWVEQAPDDWWSGAVAAIRNVMRLGGKGCVIEAVTCCGQMHAPVLLTDTGQLALPVRQAEAGLIGCAALAWPGLGEFNSAAEASRAIVRFRRPIRPIAENSKRYDAIFSAFSAIRVHMHAINKLAGQSA